MCAEVSAPVLGSVRVGGVAGLFESYLEAVGLQLSTASLTVGEARDSLTTAREGELGAELPRMVMYTCTFML